MATFSDGGDVAHVSSMAGHISSFSSSGDMRELLQNLLDSKEKQLQQAGTLGQQLLTQRMELEERIRQLQDLDLDGEDADDIRDKYRELADTIKAWDAENEQLSSAFGLKVCPPFHRKNMLECLSAAHQWLVDFSPGRTLEGRGRTDHGKVKGLCH